MTLLYLLLPVAYKFKFLTGATFKSTPMHTRTHTCMCTHQPTHTFLFSPSVFRNLTPNHILLHMRSGSSVYSVMVQKEQ